MFDFNKYHKEQKELSDGGHPIPRIVCKDGFSMSVQASKFNYASPRRDNAWPYYEVEVGFPSEVEPELLYKAEDIENPTDTVYGWVPVELIEKIVEKHGGLI